MRRSYRRSQRRFAQPAPNPGAMIDYLTDIEELLEKIEELIAEVSDEGEILGRMPEDRDYLVDAAGALNSLLDLHYGPKPY